MDHPDRKNLRLKDYDYTQNGAYFVTICTYQRRQLFGNVIGGELLAEPVVNLTATGLEVEKSIQYVNTSNKYSVFDKYVIMTNHLHCIIIPGKGSPPLYDIIKSLKTYTTKRYNALNGIVGNKLWQRNYYEHIIRNEQDYLDTWQYIDENPAKWANDEYY